MKYLRYTFALLLLAGLAFAIQPAEDWSVGTQGSYVQDMQANVTTEGGNVTQLDLDSNISTAKWAGYWGNVTGEIVLAPNNTAMFYNWIWDSSDGGEVCAIAAPSGFDWSSVQAAVGSAVDTAWFFNDWDTDSGTNTLDDDCSVQVAGTYIPVTNCTTTGSNILDTALVADTAGPAFAKYDLAFCVNITNDTVLFNGVIGDYELLTATNETAGATETHYFWLELN